jgi:hypothetical protein
MKHLEADYNSLNSWARSGAVEPTSYCGDQEVLNVLYDHKGEAISFLVDKLKLPIGYQKERK